MDESDRMNTDETVADHQSMDESAADVLGFNLKPSNTSKGIIIPNEGLPFDPDSMYYNMSGDKYLVILNHYKYQETIYFKGKRPATRTGTEKDVKALKSLFEVFDFKVTVHHDLVYDDIMKEMRKFASKNHSTTSCICVTILTHGDKAGELHAADRPYLFSDVLTIFEQQKSLATKPKLFFIQACRGGNVDAGNTVQLDSEGVITVPTHADFLILCSTVENFLSYRDANGSWMIQALCQIISNYHRELDLLHMITLMNRKVANERVTYAPKMPEINNKKQMPETRFTLTKQLKFR